MFTLTLAGEPRGELCLPSARLGACLAQDPLIDPGDEARFLGEREEGGR